MTFAIPTRLRLFLAALGLLAAAACTDVPQFQPCPNQAACEVAQLIALDLGADVGRDFGGGVTIRNVQAAGARVVIDLGLPIPGSDLAQVQKNTLHEIATAGFVVGFCEDPESETLFSLGNTFQMRSFGSDGVILGASTITSCGR